MNTYFGFASDAATRRKTDYEHFSWKFGNNCFGPPLGFLCKQDGKVAGVFGGVRKLIRIRGEDVIAFEVLNAFVAPECQGKGMFRALAEATYGAIEKASSFAYAVSPTQISVDINMAKFSFSVAFACRNLVLILNFRSGLSSAGVPSALSAVAGPPANALMELLLRARKRGARVLDSVRGIDAFPDDYDAWCEHIWDGYDFAVVKRRDYLEWRYVACPEPYRFCECKLKNGEKGYFVWKRGTWRGSTVGYIVDIMADIRNAEMRSGLTAGMIDVMKKEGIDIVSVDLQRESPLYGDLIKLGFFPRSELLPVAVRQPKYKFLLPEASDFDPRNWLVLPGDGDNI